MRKSPKNDVLRDGFSSLGRTLILDEAVSHIVLFSLENKGCNSAKLIEFSSQLILTNLKSHEQYIPVDVGDINFAVLIGVLRG